MWEAVAEAETRADPAAVWALWEKPQRWKDWNDQIARVELRGPFAVGSEARIRFRRSPASLRFRITALEPGRLFTDETRLPGARMGHEHLVERQGGTTTIRNRLFIDGPLKRVYSLFMGRRMRSSVPRFVERERILAEAGDPSTPAARRTS